MATEEFEALLGTPRGVDAAKAAALFDLPHRRLDSLAELPDALAAGTGLIEVKTDRQTNVELHRRLRSAFMTCCRIPDPAQESSPGDNPPSENGGSAVNLGLRVDGSDLEPVLPHVDPFPVGRGASTVRPTVEFAFEAGSKLTRAEDEVRDSLRSPRRGEALHFAAELQPRDREPDLLSRRGIRAHLHRCRVSLR